MIDYGFVKVIFVAAITAIVVQCAVYPVRRFFGMAVAFRMLRLSLFGFLGVTLACLAWGAFSGDLAHGLASGGWKTLSDMVLFIGLMMFVSYFMGSRYLADELERAKTGGSDAAGESGTSERRGEV